MPMEMEEIAAAIIRLFSPSNSFLQRPMMEWTTCSREWTGWSLTILPSVTSLGVLVAPPQI